MSYYLVLQNSWFNLGHQQSFVEVKRRSLSPGIDDQSHTQLSNFFPVKTGAHMMFTHLPHILSHTLRLSHASSNSLFWGNHEPTSDLAAILAGATCQTAGSQPGYSGIYTGEGGNPISMAECSDGLEIFPSVNKELLNPLRDLNLHTEDHVLLLSMTTITLSTERSMNCEQMY